jgi:hypothetical protein
VQGTPGCPAAAAGPAISAFVWGECARIRLAKAAAAGNYLTKQPSIVWGIHANFSLLRGSALLLLTASTVWGADAPPIYMDQGPSWTAARRADYYTRDQGSRIMPLAWLQALKLPDGVVFLADNLARYGYLPNPDNANGLPVGFTASGPAGIRTVGMTCSACHTRQIIAEGRTYRIDGGPAIADFQSFLADLDTSVGRVLATDAAFGPFASAVLATPTPRNEDVAALKREVEAWYARYHTLISRALPSPSWGPGRLDAVSMILNRLAGLDVGPPPSLLIPENIAKADAPVRYPFLWNAPLQDQTQWPGFADNGSDVLALARNLGQVLGVFGVFEPKREGLIINFLNNNSANFDGLTKVEELVRQIGPPKWPWLLDTNLAAQGKTIFDKAAAEGGCRECHGIAPGKVRFPLAQTWATPLRNVRTDTREYDVLSRVVKTGALKGAFIPFVTNPLRESDSAVTMLKVAVVGSITAHVFGGGGASTVAALVGSAAQDAQIESVPAGPRLNLTGLPPALRDLQGAFNSPATDTQELPDFNIQGTLIPRPPAPTSPAPSKGTYAARVLQGVWAAAPYLHNGSVPSLVELLKPASQRVATFKVGSAYDIENVGLAAEQTQFNQTTVTTDCGDLNSGNSRCGHEYGTQLSPAEKKALLEYLKSL